MSAFIADAVAARLVDELMLVSVLAAGPGAASTAAAIERAGASAALLAGPVADTYDLAILTVQPDSAGREDTRALAASLSAASERLLLLPLAADGGAVAAAGLPDLPQWFELLAEFGYQPVVEFDATFLAPGAFLVDRAAIAAESDLAAFAERLQLGEGPAPAATPAPATPREDGRDADIASLRAALAAREAEAESRAAKVAELLSQLAEAQAAAAQAQAQAAGWDRLRNWVRAAVADPARNSRAALARDLPRLNALRGADAAPVVLPPPARRRRWWQLRPRRPETPLALLADAALLRASPLFDAAWYAASVPELAEAPALDPVFHYLLVGAAAGADPGPWFDGAAYLAANPTAAASGAVPLVHAIRTGAAQPAGAER